MSWWAIDVRTPAGLTDSVGAWLVTRTGQAVEEKDDGILVAFAPDENAAARLVQDIGRETDGSVATEPRPMETVDWSLRWREGLGIRQLGGIAVVPSWLPEAANPGPLSIVLDPETAFGSGEHGSTRVALTLLGRLLRPGDLVLDLGSGSGILAIAAAKLGASRALGVELDPEANEVASRNAARNGVNDRVEFFEGDASALVPLIGPADLILSNILRVVNTALLPVISGALRPGGLAIFSGMEHTEAQEFRQALEHIGFAVIQETLDSGWWGVAAQPSR